MTDNLPSFLPTCSGLYMGNEARPSVRGRAVREGAQGRPLAAAGCVREEELGLSSPGRRVRLGRLAALDGLQAGRSGPVRGG